MTRNSNPNDNFTEVAPKFTWEQRTTKRRKTKPRAKDQSMADYGRFRILETEVTATLPDGSTEVRKIQYKVHI